MNTLYIVMPAYNEEEIILHTISQWIPIVHSIGNGSKLVIINDGSTDHTLQKLIQAEEKYKDLIVIDQENAGHGPTIIRGYQYALDNLEPDDYIFQTDSDGQTNPAEFWRFWNQRNNFSAIMGYRSHRQDGRIRSFSEHILCTLIRIFFDVKLPDANAPFRLYEVSSLEHLLPLIPKDYIIPNALLTTLFVKNAVVSFEEISFSKRKKGKNKIILRKLIKIGIQTVKDFYQFKKRGVCIA